MLVMPVMRPMPIKTKGSGFFARIWALMTVTREWKLAENYFYRLPNGVLVVVPRGFIFDGASIPRPLWFLLSPVGLLLIPGLVHDAAYRWGYLWQVDEESGRVVRYSYGDGSRIAFDDLFLKISLEVNGMILTDHLAAFLLAIFGSVAWRKNRQRNAPELRPVI